MVTITAGDFRPVPAAFCYSCGFLLSVPAQQQRREHPDAGCHLRELARPQPLGWWAARTVAQVLDPVTDDDLDPDVLRALGHALRSEAWYLTERAGDVERRAR